MQIQTDPFLGWTHIGGRQYLVRQLNDHKGSIEIDDLAGANLKAYAEVCGELLARGHAPLRRSAGDCRLHRHGRRLCRSARDVWRGLCRPDGKRLGAVEAVGQSWRRQEPAAIAALAAVDIVAAQMRRGRELPHQRCIISARSGVGSSLICRSRLHNQPANIARPHHRGDLCGRVGIDASDRRTARESAARGRWRR